MSLTPGTGSARTRPRSLRGEQIRAINPPVQHVLTRASEFQSHLPCRSLALPWRSRASTDKSISAPGPLHPPSHKKPVARIAHRLIQKSSVVYRAGAAPVAAANAAGLCAGMEHVTV